MFNIKYGTNSEPQHEFCIIYFTKNSLSSFYYDFAHKSVKNRVNSKLLQSELLWIDLLVSQLTVKFVKTVYRINFRKQFATYADPVHLIKVLHISLITQNSISSKAFLFNNTPAVRLEER